MWHNHRWSVRDVVSTRLTRWTHSGGAEDGSRSEKGLLFCRDRFEPPACFAYSVHLSWTHPAASQRRKGASREQNGPTPSLTRSWTVVLTRLGFSQARQALPFRYRVVRVEGARYWRRSSASAQAVAEGATRHEARQDPQGLRKPLQCVQQLIRTRFTLLHDDTRY